MKPSFVAVSVGTLALCGLFATSLVHAATTGLVTATVTAQNVSVSVADGTVTYGTVALSGTRDTTSSGVNDSQTATNDGNVAEDLTIKGADTTAWTISGTAIGANVYMHKFCTATCDTTPTWTPLTTSYQSLATNVAAAGTSTFDLQLLAPSSSASYTAQSVDVTVMAAAH